MLAAVALSISMFALGYSVAPFADERQDKVGNQMEMILERENEELREANEQWYKALEDEQGRKKTYMLCVCVLSIILVSNAVVNYIGILLR